MKSQSNQSLVLGVAIALAGFGLSHADPITVTGYNYDVVYEIGATGGGNGSFTNENSALYEEGLDPDPNGGNGVGLPVDRTLTDLAGGTFALAPYTGNNALIVGEGNGLLKFATWTFAPAQQVEYSRLSVVGLSAGSSSDYSFVVFFTDGTNTGSGTNIEGRFDIRGAFDGQAMPDWFANGGNSAGAVATGLGRVDSNNGNGNGVGINLQQWNFNLAAYPGKRVDHVEFESTGGQGHNRAFLAISGTPVAASTFAIKSHVFNFTTDQLQLTWDSVDTKTYRITASPDLMDWTTVLASGIAGDAGMLETSATVSFTQGAKQFIRVEEE